MMAKLARTLPSVRMLIDDLACSPCVIARALHRTPSTVRRWIATDRAPRAEHMCLFLTSRYGVSEMNADAVNAATLYAGLARALREELATERDRTGRLTRIADFGSANDPSISLAGQRPGAMAKATEHRPKCVRVSALQVTIPNAAPASRLK